MAMALEGIRVIDLGRVSPGFYVSTYLGDMGADVIKVEEPIPTGRRAGFKDVPLPYKQMEGVRGQAYNALERNKRKITLNLKDAEARKVFYRLVERSDVVLEGSRPGVAQRLGVDYETCARLNPRIVYCSLTGFGQEGPYRLMAGHDLNYLGIAGALNLVGLKDGTPVIPANLIADYAGGALFAIIGVLTALVARQHTGRGQFVDIAMTDGVVSLLMQFAQNYFMTGQAPRPGVERLNGGSPFYNVYQCKDGRWMAMGVDEPWFFANVCMLLGRPDLAEDQHDPAKGREIEEFFRSEFKTRSADEWHRLMSEEDTCVTKVLTFDEVFSDPQIRHRQMVLELKHPQVGKVRQVGIAVKLSETPGKVRAFASGKGQDTDAVLRELGYTTQEIASLRERGAAGSTSASFPPGNLGSSLRGASGPDHG